MVDVAIFDYGAGNIFSLKTSLEKNGASVDIITSFDQSKKYDGLLSVSYTHLTLPTKA